MARNIEGPMKIVELSGGRIVGKTRLQKSMYFLEAHGVGFNFGFDYHHYGPFSQELATAVSDAVALGRISEEPRRGATGLSYVVYAFDGFTESEGEEPERKIVIKPQP